jgi:DNA repair exonuclease SbcCD ATPase subunit
MRIEKIVIQNFFRVKLIELNLNNPGLNYVRGINHDVGESNETGKSTIFMAVCWCLFGKYPAAVGRVGDSVVNPTVGNNTAVGIRIFDNDDGFIIKRTRLSGENNKESKLFITYIKKDVKQKLIDYDIKGKDTKSAEMAIQQIIGMDYETFVRAYYFPQEGIQPFCSMSDRMLKTFFLERLLDIEWVEGAYENSKEDFKQIKDKIEKKVFKIDTCDDSILEHNQRIGRYESSLTEWDEKNRDDIQNEYLDLEEKLKKIPIVNTDISMERYEISQLLEELDSLPKEKPINSDYDMYISDESEASNRVSIVNSKISSLDSKIKSLKNKIDCNENLVGTQCDKCGNTITDDNLLFIHGGLEYDLEVKKEKLHVLNEELDLAKQDYNIANENRKEFQKEADETRNKNIEIQNKKRDIENSIETAFNEIKIQKERKENILSSIKEVCLRIRKLRREINPYLDYIIEEKKELLKKKEDLDVLYNELIDLREEKELVEFWVEAFSPKGIQSFLLESITDVINSYVREYMRYLSEGRIDVTFSTVKRLKNGDIREKFGINIRNMDGGDTYATLSGGAKRRVDIACSLAIGDFKRSLCNNEIEFICLDEITSGMDSHWVQVFVEMMRDRFPKYSKYFVSHQKIDENLFDKVITIEKKSGETYIESYVN